MKARAFRAAAAVVVGGATLLALAGPAVAGGATAWERGYSSQARLIAGQARAGAETLIGVHIRLDSGWNTYWRSPGDSGLPPRFDWSHSRNLKEARVLWPAPQRFRDRTGTYAGYAGEVVFPVVLKPERAGAPIDVDLTLHYAICKDLCVPAEARLSLRLPRSTVAASTALAPPAASLGRALAGAEGSNDALIARYVKRVPNQAGRDGDTPRVRHVTGALAAPSPSLVVEAEFPAGTAGADLFVEGPDGFYFPAPQARPGGARDVVRFEVDLSRSRDLERLRGESLTLTLVSDLASSETRWMLD